MESIFSNFIYQLLLTVGVVVLFGSIIAFCRRMFCRIIGPSGPKILLITGFIGTPIHELSHALMCIIFGHKITDMKLYQPDSDDGVLGYVNSSYNPRNLYHQIGNFFIGVAPIICGSGVLIGLMYLLTPALCSSVLAVFDSASLNLNSFNIGVIGEFFSVFWKAILLILDFSNMSNFLWWIFIILAFMISTHMEISPADIKTGAGGFGFIAGILLIADVVMYFIDDLLSTGLLSGVTSAIIGFSGTMVGFLGISAIFSIFMLFVAFIVKMVGMILHR